MDFSGAKVVEQRYKSILHAFKCKKSITSIDKSISNVRKATKVKTKVLKM